MNVFCCLVRGLHQTFLGYARQIWTNGNLNDVLTATPAHREQHCFSASKKAVKMGDDQHFKFVPHRPIGLVIKVGVLNVFNLDEGKGVLRSLYCRCGGA